MAKKVVIPVSFQFDDISNQIQQAKNSLKAINIESNIGQQYSKAFAQIEKEIESIQKKASQGIASQSDINSFARSFQTITGYIERIQTLSRKINFNDINLTSEQINQYKSLVQQLEKAKQNLSQFKREQIKNLFDNDQNFSQVLQSQLKISKESFTSQKQISDALNSQLKILQSQTAEKQAQIDKQKELISMIQSSAVEGLFNKYGTTNSKGGMSFKSGQASVGRQEILSAFSQFGINTDKLANASLNDLIRVWNIAKNQLQSEVPKAIQTTEQELTNLDAKQKQVVQAQEALNKAMSSGEYDKVSQEVKNASKSVEDYKTTVVQGAKETANGVGASSDKIIDSLNQQETELQKLQSQYSASVGAADLFSKMENGIKRLVGVSAVLIQVRKGVQEAVSQIKELDSAMNGIAVVTDFTTKQLWGQIDSYMAVAKQYGVTTTGVYQVSQLYYQQGQDVSNVNKLTAETLKMAGLDYATTTDYMTTALNGFKLSADDAGRVVDVYSKLASIAATDTAELAKAMSNTASIAESAGMSFESTSTFLTMMIETTRESAENLG